MPGGIVRMKGLEPPRLSAPDPKSGAATNYATSALNGLLKCAANIRHLAERKASLKFGSKTTP